MEQNMQTPPQMPPKLPKPKRKIPVWLWIVGAFVLLTLLSVLFTDDEKNENVAGDEIKQTEVAEQSLTKEQQDSLKKREEKEIKELAPLFTEKTDEIEKKTWVEPKSAPKYRNVNSVYMYFQLVDNVACNLRLVMQYEAADWLFIKHVIFQVDGVNYQYDITFKRDHDSRIWEWADVSAVNSTLTVALETAEEVKIRYVGQNYSKDIVMSQKELQSIQNTIKYYQLLGGKIIK